jgi:hypothetical protein
MSEQNKIRETIELIKQIINTEKCVNLEKDDVVKYREYIYQLFPTFANEYPSLFKKIIFRQDISMLETMLQSIEDLHNGRSEKDITTSIGESLAEKYIYPVFGKPESTNEKNPEFIQKK